MVGRETQFSSSIQLLYIHCSPKGSTSQECHTNCENEKRLCLPRTALRAPAQVSTLTVTWAAGCKRALMASEIRSKIRSPSSFPLTPAFAHAKPRCFFCFFEFQGRYHQHCHGELDVSVIPYSINAHDGALKKKKEFQFSHSGFALCRPRNRSRICFLYASASLSPP